MKLSPHTIKHMKDGERHGIVPEIDFNKCGVFFRKFITTHTILWPNNLLCDTSADHVLYVRLAAILMLLCKVSESTKAG